MLNWWCPNSVYFFNGFWSGMFCLKTTQLYVNYFNIVIVCVGFITLFCKKNFTWVVTHLIFLTPTTWLFYTIKQQPNIGLFNVLAFYHPTFLFASFFFTLCWFLHRQFFLFLTLLMSLIFIVLGSWWSSQELLWLGWWNWDGVENSLLSFITFLLLFTHNLFKKHSYHLKKNVLVCFICVFFFILNKTNIFKSIHSFTNSTVNNLSYTYVLYAILLFISLLIYIKYTPITMYFIAIWLIFFAYLLIYKNLVFYNLKFLFYTNFILLLYYIFVYDCNAFLLVFFLNSLNLTLYSAITFVLFTRLPKNYKLLHTTIFVGIGCFWVYLSEQTFNFFNNSWLNYDKITNYFVLNQKIVLSSPLVCDNQHSITLRLIPVYKNINMSFHQLYYEVISAGEFISKNFKFKLNYFSVYVYFLVTEVIYLNQKPRYNYYKCMYHFKPDLLINQQKFRRIPSKIQKNHWGTEHSHTKKIKFFLLKNQLTVDLRFYKLILRKLKKKLLKLKARVFIYILPNNKTSHKSKNSRMGKGKGMNNRFYFRTKKTKPIIIFANFNAQRYLKLKKLLSKHFDYKYV